MILASTESADPFAAQKRTKALTVLDRAEILCQALRADDRSPVLLSLPELIHPSKRRKNSDYQRAGTAESGSRRQVAHEGDVRATQRPREVLSDSAGNGHRIIRPMTGAGNQPRAQAELDAV